MRPPLHDATAVDVEDLVGSADGREAVRDHDRRPQRQSAWIKGSPASGDENGEA